MGEQVPSCMCWCFDMMTHKYRRETREELNGEVKEETLNNFLVVLFEAGFQNAVHLFCFKKYRITRTDLFIFKYK